MIALVGDGNGNIFVTDRPGYVYIRILGNKSNVAQAFNDDKEFKMVYNCPVVAGCITGTLKILSIYEAEK